MKLTDYIEKLSASNEPNAEFDIRAKHDAYVGGKYEDFVRYALNSDKWTLGFQSESQVLEDLKIRREALDTWSTSKEGIMVPPHRIHFMYDSHSYVRIMSTNDPGSGPQAFDVDALRADIHIKGGFFGVNYTGDLCAARVILDAAKYAQQNDVPFAVLRCRMVGKTFYGHESFD
jgi:hypothetical protein